MALAYDPRTAAAAAQAAGAAAATASRSTFALAPATTQPASPSWTDVGWNILGNSLNAITGTLLPTAQASPQAVAQAEAARAAARAAEQKQLLMIGAGVVGIVIVGALIMRGRR